MIATVMRVLFALFSAMAVTGCEKLPVPASESAGGSVVGQLSATVPEFGDNSFAVTTEGIGRVTVGMTRGQFEAATGAKVMPSEGGCGDNPVDIVGGPDTMSIVLSSNDIIYAIAVDDIRYATAEGAKVGMTAAELRQIYGARLMSFPYEGDSDPPQYGQYSIAAADGSRSIAFTMKEARVSFITVIRGTKGFMDLC